MSIWTVECETVGEWPADAGNEAYREWTAVLPAFGDEIGRLCGDLPGNVTGSEGGARVRMELEAGSAGEAFVVMLAVVNRAAGGSGMPQWPIVGVRITRKAEAVAVGECG